MKSGWAPLMLSVSKHGEGFFSSLLKGCAASAPSKPDRR